ncbi:UbiA family prenyltransferase [Polynucleobacter wuianus]|uniref:UbiA family prenyltransferase n=1 Tax=Polynucleobacter wuianus TaxID=1743168 RepID=UPI001C0CF847|nr:UbiA family prenyltransferase [Polynucleobacter wuianus]MBU3611222.1 UbiA family prenyltransferase [Polynucleobacter wuianus]
MTNNKATFADYLKITRLDHGTKQVFIIPGIFFAYLLRGIHVSNPLSHILLGFLCATAIASANYVINEWFDREFDKFHPTKFKRTAVQRILTGKAIAFEWSLLVGIGLLAAYLSSKLMFIVACIFFYKVFFIIFLH